MLRISNTNIIHTDMVSVFRDWKKAGIVQYIAHQHDMGVFLSSDREAGQIERGWFVEEKNNRKEHEPSEDGCGCMMRTLSEGADRIGSVAVSESGLRYWA